MYAYASRSFSRLAPAAGLTAAWTSEKTGHSLTQRAVFSTTTPQKGFVQWYEGHLQARPIPTKMVTGSFLWGLGDAVAQVVPPVAAGQAMPEYDWARTGRAAFFGFALHAPLSHLHFNLLEWMTVRLGVQGLKIPVFKAFMEQVSLLLCREKMMFMRVRLFHCTQH